MGISKVFSIYVLDFVNCVLKLNIRTDPKVLTLNTIASMFYMYKKEFGERIKLKEFLRSYLIACFVVDNQKKS